MQLVRAISTLSTRPLSILLACVLTLTVLPLGAGPVAAASTTYMANCGADLRTTTDPASAVLDSIPAGTIVAADATVSGSAWSADCPNSVSGSAWYAITTINGVDASATYGSSPVYAPSGLFSPVTATGAARLEGVDVSRWQGSIDFEAVRASGRRFVIAKASEGVGYTDPKWATNKSAARAAGLALGAYHFARPDLNPTNPAAEADWFVTTMGLAPGMLMPTLDIEVSGGLSAANLTAWVKDFLERVYARTGVRAMIYVSPAFFRTKLGNTRWFADNGYGILWIAHWTTADGPDVPADNWGGRSWTFWQYTSNGSVPGITGRVDLNRYNGSDLTGVTYSPDFKLTLSANSLELRQGASGSATISLVRNWFTLPISLSVDGLPEGVVASLDTDTLIGDSATLTLATTNGESPTPVGTATIVVTATGGDATTGGTITHTARLPLIVVDGIAPQADAPGSRLYATTTLGSTSVFVRTNWSAIDESSGVASTTLQRQANGGAWSTVKLASTSTLAVSESLTTGATYGYRVRALDRAGNVSAWVYGIPFVATLTQQTSSAVRYSSGWYTSRISYASGGSLRYATRRDASVSHAFTGRSIAWVAYRGPNRGRASVYIDGAYVKTVDLRASSYRARQVVFAASWPTAGAHTIKIVNQATAGRPRIDLDAFVRLSDR